MGSMISTFDHFIPTTYSRWLQFILSTPVVLWAGWPFFERRLAFYSQSSS